MGWEIHEFEIMEHSITPIPANAEAQIISTKLFNGVQDEIDKHRAALYLIDCLKKVASF